MISGAISETALLRFTVRDLAGLLARTGLGRRAPRRWSDINCCRRSAQGRRLVERSQKDRSAIRLRSDLLRLRWPAIESLDWAPWGHLNERQLVPDHIDRYT